MMSWSRTAMVSGGGSELELGEAGGIAGMASDVGRLSMFTSKANMCGPSRSPPLLGGAADPHIDGCRWSGGLTSLSCEVIPSLTAKRSARDRGSGVRSV